MLSVAALLEPPPAEATSTHYEKVIQLLDAKVKVQDAGPGRGKGVFATADFQQGDVIWRERPLVSHQERDSQHELLACSHCHRYVGSVELQIARLLRHVQKQSQALQEHKQQQAAQSESNEPQGQPAGSASSSMPGNSSTGNKTIQGDGGAGDADLDDAQDDGVVQELQYRAQLLEAFITPKQLDDLESGSLKLPHTEQIPLPTPVSCEHGCSEVYCSTECKAAAWQQYHCLLCPGPCTTPAEAAQDGRDDQPCQGSLGHSDAVTMNRVPLPKYVHGMKVERQHLQAFYAHAEESNDIFRLAARLLAKVSVQAASQLLDHTSGLQHEAGSRAAGGSSSSQTEQAEAINLSDLTCSGSQTEGAAVAALASAWLPYAAGWKRVWWEAVAVPEDVSEEEGGEQEFRQQLRMLASDSLALLVAALPGPAAAWPALFSLEVWGAVIGMFELNNLGLVVPSPVEDYFLLIDDLPDDQKAAAQEHTQPWLDALDKWYDTPVEGTGFYALQSCSNHSCAPNAATEGESDGRVAVYALQPISAGQEITISYLDEDAEHPMTLRERQAALKDYGFTCACSRCQSEARPRRPAGSMKGKGVKLGRR